jgi:hypothetical protein
MKFKSFKFSHPFLEQGKIYTTYRELEKIFGKPQYGPGKEETAPNDLTVARATCMWRIVFEDGTYACIYDNRQTVTNYGWYQWFVGGVTGTAFFRVKEAIEQYRKIQKV